eukprot:8074218-Lingulodinium_polyedra.AAC.1
MVQHASNSISMHQRQNPPSLRHQCASSAYARGLTLNAEVAGPRRRARGASSSGPPSLRTHGTRE